MAAYFRKKPEVVEAMRFEKPWEAVTAWCPDLTLIYGKRNAVHHGIVRISAGSYSSGNIGDWIIKDSQGWFSWCFGEVFEAFYEPVTTPPWDGASAELNEVMRR